MMLAAATCRLYAPRCSTLSQQQLYRLRVHVCLSSPTTASTATSLKHQCLLLHRQSFYSSSISKSVNASIVKNASIQNTPIIRSSRWHRLARIVRYTRIPFLVLSVYGLGYQQGIIDDSRNPTATRQSLLENVYASAGVKGDSRQHVHIVTDGDESSISSILKSASQTNKDAKRIAHIGRSIVKVARQYVQEQLETIAKEIKDQLPADVSEQQFLTILLKHDEFQLWHKAKSQLEGNWSYLLLETKVPNAFVSEILPKRIFVTIAMLDIIQNDDELALVLGHEVSHLILGHLSERNRVETMLRTIEILLLSLDPTEGLLSLALVGSLATIRKAFTAAFSRDHEREADELGIKLAAMACYDTQRASIVFQRLHEQEMKGSPTSGSNTLLSFADSHPPTAERYRDLVTASETENAEAYTDNCAVVKKRLEKASAAAGSSGTKLVW